MRRQSLKALICLQSFWQPGDTPDSDKRAKKPKLDVTCPVTGNKLKLKDLTAVKFTPVPDGDGTQFMDPVTKDIFTNSSHIVVLKATGDAMLEKTYKSCVKPDGHYNGAFRPFCCIICGKQLYVLTLWCLGTQWHA